MPQSMPTTTLTENVVSPPQTPPRFQKQSHILSLHPLHLLPPLSESDSSRESAVNASPLPRTAFYETRPEHPSPSRYSSPAVSSFGKNCALSEEAALPFSSSPFRRRCPSLASNRQSTTLLLLVLCNRIFEYLCSNSSSFLRLSALLLWSSQSSLPRLSLRR